MEQDENLVGRQALRNWRVNQRMQKAKQRIAISFNETFSDVLSKVYSNLQEAHKDLKP